MKAIYLGENDVGDYCLKDLVGVGAFDRATTLIFDVLKCFREHRAAFMWYVRVAIGDKLHEALPNPGKVSLLEKTIILHGFVRNKFFQTEDPDTRKEFRDIEKMLDKNSYEFVRQTLRNCKAGEASNFYNLVRNTRSLPDDVKDGMLAAILRTRPEVAKERIEAEENAAGEMIIDERIIYVSRAGYLRYEAEFKKLVNDEIPRNAREIGRAASYGDLSENAEWTAALEKQGILSRRAEEMQAAIEKARILDDSMITDGAIAVGSSVTLKNMTSQSEESYTILGPWDADMEKGIISYLAPLGRALLGKKGRRRNAGRIAQRQGDLSRRIDRAGAARLVRDAHPHATEGGGIAQAIPPVSFPGPRRTQSRTQGFVCRRHQTARSRQSFAMTGAGPSRRSPVSCSRFVFTLGKSAKLPQSKSSTQAGIARRSPI